MQGCAGVARLDAWWTAKNEQSSWCGKSDSRHLLFPLPTKNSCQRPLPHNRCIDSWLLTPCLVLFFLLSRVLARAHQTVDG